MNISFRIIIFKTKKYSYEQSNSVATFLDAGGTSKILKHFEGRTTKQILLIH